MGPHGGSHAQQIVVPEPSAVPAPHRATFPEAATLLLNASTARLSVDAPALRRGQTVAVVGGAGGVGGYAIQLAKADGLGVLTDASSADKELVASLGADTVIDQDRNLATRSVPVSKDRSRRSRVTGSFHNEREDLSTVLDGAGDPIGLLQSEVLDCTTQSGIAKPFA